MRRIPATAQTSHLPLIPRGWIVLAAALGSWLLVAAIWTAMAQLFSYVLAAF